ncbi:hypothetical protein EMCRGX_G018381 [Ephydatia muelleri]
MFGRQANIPVDLMDSLNQGQEKELPDYVHQLREGLKETFALVRNLCESEHQRQKAIYTTRRFMENLFSKGDMVWLFSPAVPRGRWKKFHQPWKGPFIVEEKKGSSTFKIKPQVIARPDTPHDDEDLLLSDDEDGGQDHDAHPPDVGPRRRSTCPAGVTGLRVSPKNCPAGH